MPTWGAREANRARSAVTAFLMRSRQDEGPAAPFIAAIRRDLVDPLGRAEPSLSDQIEQVQRMSAAVAAGGKLEGLDLVSLGGRDGSPAHVNLLTLHSSKGCEYDVVMRVGM